MRVIIMRHGDAIFRGAERVLSSRGEQEARLTGLKLVSAFNITKIFCSSKYRAQQSAQIVHDLLRGPNIPEVQVINELNPYGNASLVRDYLEATCDDNDTVVLVSHIPQVLNLSWVFCQQELNLPTFFTAGALILESKKSSDSDDVSRYYPCWFLAPNREVKLINAASTPSAAASAYAAAALAAHEASPLAEGSYVSPPTASSDYIPSSISSSNKASASSFVFRESPPSSSLSSPFAAISSVSTFELQAKTPNNTLLAQFVANQDCSLNSSAYNVNSRTPASSVASASVAVAAVAATALVGPASALVAPAVELGETGSLALPLAAAVAAASVTIPVVRKVQSAPSHDYNTNAQKTQKISAATSCNSHSKRMLAKLARSSL